MLHLAQVRKNYKSGEWELKLLAYQKADNFWELDQSGFLPLNDNHLLNEGLLVLVELDENQDIFDIQEGTEWIIGLIEKYLVNPDFSADLLQEEAEKVEEWRQELALKSQDLTRRHLEIETRREQLQDLEEKLKKEEETLQSKREQLQELEEKLKGEE